MLLGFLTAVLQNHARKKGMSVDSLQFDFTVQTSVEDTEESLSDLKRKLVIKRDAFEVR